MTHLHRRQQLLTPPGGYISDDMYPRSQDEHGKNMSRSQPDDTKTRSTEQGARSTSDRTPTVSSLLNEDVPPRDMHTTFHTSLPPMLSVQEPQRGRLSPLPILEPQAYTWAGPQYASGQHGLPSPVPTNPYSPASHYSQAESGHEGSIAQVQASYNPVPAVESARFLPFRNVQWSLNIRQQPVAARACGYGNRDRYGSKLI